jgi:hypothetical protein
MSGLSLEFTPLEPELSVADPDATLGAQRTGLGGAIGAGYRSAAEQGFRRDDARRTEALGIYREPIDRAFQGYLDLPDEIMRSVAEEGFDPSADTLYAIRGWVEENGAQYGYDVADFEDPEDIIARREEITQEATDYVNEQNEILSRASGGTRLAGQLIGGVGAEFTDPFNVLTLPAGAPARAGLAATVAIEAAINAGLELAEVGARNRIAEELGQEEQSPLEAATIGALFGAGGAAAFRGIEVAGVRGFERLGRMLSQRELRAIAELAAQSENAGEAALGNALLQDLAEQGQVGANTMRIAEEEHQQRLERATEMLNEGTPDRSPNIPATLRPIEDDPGGRLEMADIRNIEVDADRGAPTRRITQDWDDNRAGVSAIFERADGTRVLVDGRARLEAAQREGVTALPSRIYREEDGFDIQELRDVINEQQRFRNEPITSAARVMEAMSDDLFEMVTSGSIDGAIATVVARTLADRPELQLAMGRALLDRGIAGPEAAARAIPQLNEGLEPVTPPTDAAARQKVFARAMEDLGNDAELMERLRQDAAENGQPNRPDGELLQDLREAIVRNQGSPAIQRILNDAARRYASTGRLGDGAGRFISGAADFVRRQGRNGPGAGRDGGNAQSQAPDPQVSDGLEGFDDPLNGAGVDGQIANTPLVRDPPPEGFSDDLEGRLDLKQRVEDGADRAEIDNHPTLLQAVVDMEAAAANATDLDLVYNTREWHDTRQYVFPGDEIEVGTRAAMQRFRADAESFAGELGPVRGRRATILLGPPAAGKSTIAEGLALDQRAAILDPDEIKKTLPEYEGGVGAAAVHEESSDLTKILEALMRAEGTNMIVPKVGGSVGSIQKLIDRMRESGYDVAVVNMAVEPDEAYRRMIGRFVDTGRIIPPKYMDEVGNNPTLTYQTLRDGGAADGFAEIDNNGAFRAPKPVTERSGSFDPIAGSRFDLSEGRGNLLGGSDGGAGGNRGGSRTADIIRRDSLADRVAVSVEDVEGTNRAVTMTRRELEADITEDENFAQVLAQCVM